MAFKSTVNKCFLTVQLVACICTVSFSANAANCDWLGGSGNWTSSNWNTCLGSFPSSGDIASIATGTVTLDQSITLQQLNLSAGIIDGNNNLSISGQTNITGGNSTMRGTGITRADGGLTIDGNFMDIQGSRSLVNGAGQTANWTSGSVRLLNTGSTLVNEISSVFNITGNSRNLSGGGTFENAASINVALTSNVDVLTVSSGLQNNGTITAQNGTLALSTDATGSGQWHANGGKIQVNSNADITTTGAIGVSNGGELEINNNASMSGSNLTMDATATLETIGNNTLSLSGDLSFAMTNEAQWLFDDASTLEMAGGTGAAVGNWAAWSSLEIGGFDIGTDPLNHVGDPSGFSNNFDLAELVIGADAHVFLSDIWDNGNRNGTFGAEEALYVDTLMFADASALLNLNGLHIYYKNLIGNTDQIIDQTVVPVPAAVWLFGSGLIGLIGIARRKKA